MKGATGLEVKVRVALLISIHAPVKGATIMRTLGRPIICNFNPRSREGSDLFPILRFAKNSISIHAPVKGATPTR